MPSQPDSTSSAATTGHELAFGILCAALGEVRAWALWNRWTADQRDEVAAFAEDHFGAQLRSLADELIAWEERVMPPSEPTAATEHVVVRPSFVRLYRHFRSGGIYRYAPRSRSNALYMAWKYWRKGTRWHVGL